jgi:hypothetical protein
MNNTKLKGLTERNKKIAASPVMERDFGQA